MKNKSYGKERVAIQAIAAGIVMCIGLVQLRKANEMINCAIDLLAGVARMTAAYDPYTYYRKK